MEAVVFLKKRFFSSLLRLGPMQREESDSLEVYVAEHLLELQIAVGFRKVMHLFKGMKNSLQKINQQKRERGLGGNCSLSVTSLFAEITPSPLTILFSNSDSIPLAC